MIDKFGTELLYFVVNPYTKIKVSNYFYDFRLAKEEVLLLLRNNLDVKYFIIKTCRRFNSEQ